MKTSAKEQYEEITQFFQHMYNQDEGSEEQTKRSRRSSHIAKGACDPPTEEEENDR